MQGLYKKVIKGEYPAIPKTFSQDLSFIISNLIQLNPALRMNSSQIIAIPIVARHIQIIDEQESENLLLKTIVFPATLENLPEQLPKSNFEDQPPQRNKSNALPKLKTINRQIILREKSEPPVHTTHSGNERSSDKSLYYLKHYREMILKENYGALRVPKIRCYYNKNTGENKDEREESSVLRVKSEKNTRKQGTNKSMLLRIEQKIL